MSVGVGVLALGNAAHATIPALVADARVRLIGGADPNPARRAIFSERFRAPAFDDLEALLAVPGLDAVAIASPTFLHHEHAVRCLRAGKHVLLEKPIAANAADARAIVETARAHDLIVVVGHTHAFDAPVRAMRELVRSGRYGEPLGVVSMVATDWTYRMRRPDELARELGGGVVFNQGAHQVDVVRSIIGGDVTAVSATVHAADAARGDGSYYALLRFGGGAAASLTYSGYDRFSTLELTLGIGERGERSFPTTGASRAGINRFAGGPEEARARETMTPPRAPDIVGQPFFGFIVVSCEDADIRQSSRGLYVYTPDGHEEIELKRESTHGSVVAEFVEAIISGTPALHDGAWAAATLDVCLAIIESSEARREISFAQSGNR